MKLLLEEASGELLCNPYSTRHFNPYLIRFGIWGKQYNMSLPAMPVIVKQNTCFKSVENPSCFDLILTDSNRFFPSTNIISTGISDCHKKIITVLKTIFKKSKPIRTCSF